MSNPTFPYTAADCRCYYGNEATFGVFNATVDVYSLPWFNVEPDIKPNLIKVRTVGSQFPSLLKKGMREGRVRLGWYMPNFIKPMIENLPEGKARSIQVLYFLGTWASPTNMINLLYTGCRATTLTIEAKAAEAESEAVLINLMADYICQNLAVYTSKQTTGAYVDSYSAPDKTFYDSYVKADTSVLESCVAWKFTLDLHLKPIPVIRVTDGDLMKFLQIRHKDAVAELDFEFESKDRFNDVLNDTARDWELGLGATGKYIDLQDCKAELVGAPTRVGDIIFCKVKLAPLSASIVVT